MNAMARHTTRLLPTRQIVSAAGALSETNAVYRMQCLQWPLVGDWGCCDDEVKATNNKAVTLGNRILSSYPLDPAKPYKSWGDNTLWIIIGADHSATTLLLSWRC